MFFLFLSVILPHPIIGFLYCLLYDYHHNYTDVFAVIGITSLIYIFYNTLNCVRAMLRDISELVAILYGVGGHRKI